MVDVKLAHAAHHAVGALRKSAGLKSGAVAQTSPRQLAERAVELGLASRDELAACADAWHSWASHSDAWFVVVHGEILASA